MLKPVPAGSLKLGMYIHEPDASWMDYPQWKTRFLLTDPVELEALRTSGVRAFIIDTNLGLDIDLTPVRPRAVPDGSARPAAPANNPCSAEEEFGRAAAIVDKARDTVQHVLKQARLGKAIDVARTMPVIEAITGSIERNGSALISYARIKAADEYTYLHSVAVCALMINLGRQLLFDEQALAELGTAGLLHDIGKAAVPVELITKPGPLTPLEMAQVRQHTTRGAELLGRNKGVTDVAIDVCLHHHERIDGRGYPHALRGDQISLPARRAAVCDVYDAMTSKRSYKEADAPAEALAAMFGVKGQFDESVLSAFIRSVGIYPIGSLVRLKSGHLAVVIEQNAGELTKPRVRAFYSAMKRVHVTPADIDLASAGDEILSRERPERWGFSQWDAMWSHMLRGDRLSSAA